MRVSKTLMTGAVAAVAVAGSANAGFVDNFNRSLANGTSGAQFTTSISATIASPGGGFSRTNDPLAGTAFSRRVTSVQNLGSSATMTGNGSAVFVLGRATGGTGANAASATNENGFGSMNLNYFDNSGAFANLTGTTSFSINVGSYTGGDTIWTLDVGFDSQSEFDFGFLQLQLTNSNIVSGVLTFNVADMVSDGTINWAKVDFINLGVKRTEWGAANSTAGFTLSNFQYNVIPAPGAIALLGMAGVAGRRRRA